jgi:hypothetical protein
VENERFDDTDSNNVDDAKREDDDGDDNDTGRGRRSRDVRAIIEDEIEVKIVIF